MPPIDTRCSRLPYGPGNFRVDANFCRCTHEGHGYMAAAILGEQGRMSCGDAYALYLSSGKKLCSKYVDGCFKAVFTKTDSRVKNTAQALFMRFVYGVKNWLKELFRK